ncbi:MAG TPA: glycosyltransferase family 4 protein [Solirubrobacteraceae bacterium]|nr:glycosyltransferase family 4 protein [Solirubrobacteraceae bacterium]
MRVLYVNHTAEVSGAERSLLSLLEGLPDTVEPLLATPPGRLAGAARELGVRTATIPGTAGSLRLHPLHTSRALGEMGGAAHRLRSIAQRHGSELVHANSIRAGIVLGLARVAPTPTVIHIRDCLPPGPVTTATMRLIAAAATTVVANSEYTANWVRSTAPSAAVEVVHNPVDLRRWDPERIDRLSARARLGAAGERQLLLGVVAQLTPWKGQDTAIDALRLLCEQGVDAHLLLIGSAKFVARATRFDNQGYEQRLRAQVASARLEDRVSWLGEREDVPELVRALDVLLLPSWEEPFGRALIEAMALNVPVVATSVGGPPEIIEDGREGFLVAPRDPQAWADALRRIADEPRRGWELGRAGRRRVESEFSLEHHVAAMMGVYERALAR